MGMNTSEEKPLRTQEQIVAKMKQVEDTDFFGVIRSDLLNYLDYEHAKEFLKPEAKEEQWNFNPLTREKVLGEMLEYMPFAWDKAINMRGLSAGRSMHHYTAWVWLIGDEEVFGNLEDYQFYGKDNLRKICEHYGWNADQWDDGIRCNC